ncbi:MAG: hypothetical protein WCW77_05770 [Patescibacteria group bacterium]|jgi:Tfp pilus assembly protein PilV
MTRKKLKIGKYLKIASGFSILEVVIAIFIITMGLVGILSLVELNLKANYINKNNLIASMLAQEGLELVRNKRDYNFKNGLAFDANIAAGTYAIDPENMTAVTGGISDPAARLKYNTAGYFCHGNWSGGLTCNGANSPFSRLLTITKTGGYLNVRCQVRYSKGNSNYEYAVQNQLYDWK